MTSIAPLGLKFQDCYYTFIITLMPIQILSIQKIPESRNLPGLIVFILYIKKQVLLQSRFLTFIVLYLSSDIIFIKRSTNFFLTNIAVFVSRLAGPQRFFRILWIFKSSLNLFLVLVKIRILISQYSLSIITSNIF